MDKDELLRRYLEGDLTEEQERKALHAIADDDDMRAMLRFEQTLSETLRRDSISYDKDVVPEGFADGVMHKIEQLEEHEETADGYSQIREWFHQLWAPKQIRLRPAYAFVLILLVAVSFSLPFLLDINPNTEVQIDNTDQSQKMGSSIQQVSAHADQVLLRFVYIDGNASSIAVAGDFSNWKKIKLSKQIVNGQQVWTALVSMSRGEHNYMFVKNGTDWVTDPMAPVQRDDGFGNKNAVIYI